MKKKIKKYLFFYFSKNLKYRIYKKNIYKIVNFSKKNFNIINYDSFFFIFSKIDLNDLEKITNLLKILKIDVLWDIPFKYLINYNYSKTNSFFSFNDKNILYKYKKIDFYSKNISKLLLSNNFLANDIFNYNEEVYKKFKSKIYNLKSNITIKKFFKFIFKKKKKRFFNKTSETFKKEILKTKKYLYSNKNFNLDNNFLILSFLIKNIKKNSFKKKSYIYKSLVNFLKNKKMSFKIGLNIIDDIYRIILEKYNYINSLRIELYDSVSNILNISYLKFNFFFLKHGSNLKWILNLLEINSFDNKFLKIKNILRLKQLSFKKIENKYFISIRKLFKIFNLIKINKLKLDLAKNDIIKSKLNIVNKLTKKHYMMNNYNDILQESKLSLIKSINIYKQEYGISLNNFIIKNIKKKINNYIYRSSRLIELPYYITTLMNKIKRTVKEYNILYNQNPDIDYIKDKLEVSKDKIKKVINYYKEPISINKSLFQDDNELLESLNNSNNFDFDEEIFNNDLRDYIESLMIKFNNRSSNIISMRYGINFSRRYTLEEIGNIYSLSKERIRQIQNENLKELKLTNDSDKLKNYFNYKYKYYKFKD